MQTIQFMPDRLNAEPTVFRGFTTPELGLVSLFGSTVGLVVSLFFIPFIGWVVIPTFILVTPLLAVVFGGKYLVKIKRGKPENYIYRSLALRKREWGIGDYTLIIHDQAWSLRRERIRKI
ncbi:TIGR03750 family conjugal transfer protein [Xenorhabdus bovienii]|uniref:TIGR03750 family conjugal transfer protein n=1 Tax=Xenorhabdus bovienii TaxID=40576 RepID=UPI00237CA3B5|nr:TIGR03750 family conjugal transfer protein [Xenorhabdus bovienii]MDE1485152.1 TIGR03750 family conjugal transfer protein [Xenorhabdus bovienii]MDE9476015.1 TIGR03750 family conjugal transfer protein [Xenorhabdus bovienii]MDE9528783.1 TIGR03750 family conjugal transfer protein [Xenorhabdus bovienii]